MNKQAGASIITIGLGICMVIAYVFFLPIINTNINALLPSLDSPITKLLIQLVPLAILIGIIF